MIQPTEIDERDRMLTELARREAGQSTRDLSDAEESTLADLKRRLDTLATDLGELPPVDEFAEESDCRRAVEMVEQIARDGNFSPSWRSGADEAAAVEAAHVDVIGAYRITAKLGRGGMGTVYKAVHPLLKRDVAIKVLPAGRIRDAAAIARFEREMATVGGLDHPNIVVAHDAGEADGMHYLVMEYVDGLDLSTLVRRLGPLPIADACEIVRQTARGLQAAADRGIVHRDVKPSNLMLAQAAPGRDEAIVKILDFGLARLAAFQASEELAAGEELTTSGLVMGTLRYMAPEQCSKSHDVDIRADVYSLGATLYKLLCGASPYSEERFNSPLALLAALGSKEPPPALATRRPDVAPPLAAIVHRMMAFDPAERIAAPEEVIAALEPWAQGANLAALLASARGAEEPAATPAAIVVAPSSTANAKGKSPRTARAAIGLAILGIAGALAVFAASSAWRPQPEILVGELQRFDLEDPSFARSRETAEWLLARHAHFGVISSRQGSIDVKPGAQLPDGLLQITVIDLNEDTHLRNDDLAHFAGLPLLDLLNLSFTNIGDKGVRQLRDLPALKHLFLVQTQVTDASLEGLSRFPQLETLFLKGTKITNAGLASLVRVSGLRELMLTNCDVSDAGIVHLRQLTKLGKLYIHGTQITPRGIAELQAALPACLILSHFPPEQISAAAAASLKPAD